MKRRKKEPEWTEMWDILGGFRGFAWKKGSIYTSYLLYVEPRGSC